jgi:hypothetical protein
MRFHFLAALNIETGALRDVKPYGLVDVPSSSSEHPDTASHYRTCSSGRCSVRVSAGTPADLSPSDIVPGLSNNRFRSH